MIDRLDSVAFAIKNSSGDAIVPDFIAIKLWQIEGSKPYSSFRLAAERHMFTDGFSPRHPRIPLQIFSTVMVGWVTIGLTSWDSSSLSSFSVSSPLCGLSSSFGSEVDSVGFSGLSVDSFSSLSDGVSS